MTPLHRVSFQQMSLQMSGMYMFKSTDFLYRTDYNVNIYISNNLTKTFNVSHSVLSRSNSGTSVECLKTPLKLVEKDSVTGEYIVKMSPQDFDRLLTQGCVVPPSENATEK